MPARIRRGYLAATAALVALVGALAGGGPALAGHAAAGAAATPAATTARPAVAYPLAMSASRRYLVDASGKPFLIVGDSPQGLIADLSEKEADAFFANREAAGFNSMWINLLCNDYTGGRKDGTTYDGIAPFTTPGDVSTPNEAYFARVDAMVRLAAAHNLTVFLDPIETGGWLSTLLRNGVDADYAYGRYIGRRYADFPNIVWLNGNDFEDWRHPEVDAVVLAVARGIQDTDHNHLQTVELNNPESGSLDDKRWRPYLSLDGAYTYHPTYARVLKEYNRRHHLPTFMIEANYEYEYSYAGPQTLRRQEYWTMLSGASGQFYGNKWTWQFLRGWQRHIDTSGVTQLGYVTKLFAGRPWYDLVPDQQHRVVTSGYGRFAAGGTVNNSQYVTAASTPDGRLAIAYLPDLTELTVDLSTLSGPVRAEWYDPSAGRYRPAARSLLPNKGKHRFVPPRRNHEGTSAWGTVDWVLVLTAGR